MVDGRIDKQFELDDYIVGIYSRGRTKSHCGICGICVYFRKDIYDDWGECRFVPWNKPKLVTDPEFETTENCPFMIGLYTKDER